MKWVFALKEKVKVAFFLAFLAGIIILFNLLMKSNVSGLESSIKSIYKDRLLAGAAISTIIEINYKNHLLLEEHIHTNKAEQYNKLEKEIKLNTTQADSLLSEFKKTILVVQEKQALKKFVQTNLAYRSFQNDLLLLSRNGEKKETYNKYLHQGNKLFGQVLAPAHQLSGIQIKVGEDIYKASRNKVYGAQVISTLEAALVVIILIGTYALVIASNSIAGKSQKYWLN
jgi:hypothetical protein